MPLRPRIVFFFCHLLVFSGVGLIKVLLTELRKSLVSPGREGGLYKVLELDPMIRVYFSHAGIAAEPCPRIDRSAFLVMYSFMASCRLRLLILKHRTM